MNFTAAQKRLLAESDESTRQREREASTHGDPQNTLAYAVEYLRNNPKLAKEAGLNALTPKDINTLRKGFNDLLDMLNWISDRTDSYTFWNSFQDDFPTNIPTDDDYNGGWARIDEIVDEVQRILNFTR